LLSLEFEFDIKGKKKTWWVCNYFGLHGSYRIDDDKIVPNYDKGNKNVHISLEFKKTDSESSYLNYYDTSGFGTSFTFYNNLDEYLKYLYKNAIDVFDEEFDIKTFKKNFEIVKLKPLSKFNIASILINQGYLCSGIGNYLKCEILYEAKINPNRSINDIKDEELEVLYKAIKKVCELHLSKEGRSEEHLKVYGKKVDADGNEIKYEETQDGKKTYWVPEIQK
jgi:formamidopyrimidine-DNA glycosylase